MAAKPKSESTGNTAATAAARVMTSKTASKAEKSVAAVSRLWLDLLIVSGVLSDCGSQRGTRWSGAYSIAPGWGMEHYRETRSQ